MCKNIAATNKGNTQRKKYDVIREIVKITLEHNIANLFTKLFEGHLETLVPNDFVIVMIYN